MESHPTSLGRRGCARSRRGFTLLEMAAVMFVLALLLIVIFGLLWSSVRIEQVEAAAFQRAVAISTLADQFRADAHAAQGTLKLIEQFAAGRNLLIMQKSNGDLVIYRWSGVRLERILMSGGRYTNQPVPVPKETAAIELEAANDGTVTITLRPEVPSPGCRPVHIRAALGGNRL